MEKKYFIYVIVLVVAATLGFFYPKSYYPIGSASTQCKASLIQKSCLGKSVSTQTANVCAPSAICYGWLTQ